MENGKYCESIARYLKDNPKYCESIARYLKDNPKEAEFWKQNYSEWCKTTEPRQPQPAETTADELLVDDNTSGPEINDAANDLFLNV